MALAKSIAQRISFNCIKSLSAIRIQACNYCRRVDAEKETHTGQIFDEKDYRNVRFTNAARYVNENWGIKLIDQIPPKEVTERVVYCDGGDSKLGHPKVYINLDKPGPQICGYCGLRFVKKNSH